MSRYVFHCVGAYVGSLHGETDCRFWADAPAKLRWDHNAMVAIDLARSPTAARLGRIAPTDVDVDDHEIYGGMTKIGPLFPDGKTIGACWLTEEAWRRSTNRAFDADPECEPYELTQVVYWAGALASRRFQGFRAVITSEQGSRALVTLWHAGTSRTPNAQPAGTWWIDLDTEAMPIEPGFTEVGVGAAVKTGALFLDLRQASTIQLYGPKRPPGAGEAAFPSPDSEEQ